MVATLMPSGPRAHFPGAHLLAFARDMLGFVCRLKQEYGDVVAFRLGPERIVLLSHPAHLHAGLVRQHRTFQKGHRGDMSKQWFEEGLLNSEEARSISASAASCNRPFIVNAWRSTPLR
jgi:hypothetical protein